MKIGQDPRLEGDRQERVTAAKHKARYALMSKLANDKIELATYLDVMGRTHLIESAKGAPKIEKLTIKKYKVHEEKKEEKRKIAQKKNRPIPTNQYTNLFVVT